jgi:hypothetical protein
MLPGLQELSNAACNFLSNLWASEGTVCHGILLSSILSALLDVNANHEILSAYGLSVSPQLSRGVDTEQRNLILLRLLWLICSSAR